MKNKILLFFYENLTLLSDIAIFILVVSVGIFIKMYREVNKGVRTFNWKWLFAEAIISFLVAFSVWAFFDQFLEMKKPFIYVICAWAGSFSTVFHTKLEELLSYTFDSLKIWISKKLGTNETNR